MNSLFSWQFLERFYYPLDFKEIYMHHVFLLNIFKISYALFLFLLKMILYGSEKARKTITDMCYPLRCI